MFDDDLPVISDIFTSPSSVSQGGFVNISCNVTDNIGVIEVFVNITYPDFSFEINGLDVVIVSQFFVFVKPYHLVLKDALLYFSS